MPWNSFVAPKNAGPIKMQEPKNWFRKRIGMTTLVESGKIVLGQVDMSQLKDRKSKYTKYQTQTRKGWDELRVRVRVGVRVRVRVRVWV